MIADAEIQCSALAGPPDVGEARVDSQAQAARVRALVDAHFDFVWRTLRYSGLNEADAEDAAQEVMCVLARRITDVVPGVERPFLFSTATRVAASWRRTARRRPEARDEDVDAIAAAGATVEELVDERRAYDVLQHVLQQMPIELRLVFVLYEIEELTTPAIAAMIGVSTGTTASRLRLARERFQQIVKRVRAAERIRGATP